MVLQLLLRHDGGFIEPRAYLPKVCEELGARRERVVVPFGLERWSYQIRRDDVQV